MRRLTNDRLYVQIEQDLRSKILRGAFRPGQRLPSEKELAKTYGVTHLTLRRAQQGLVAEGLLHKRDRSGTFISELAGVQRHLLLVCGLKGISGTSSLVGGVGPYHQGCMEYSAQAARGLGFAVDTLWEYAQNADVATAGRLSAASGAIFVGCEHSDRLVARAGAEGLHYVSLGKSLAMDRAVWFDIAQAADIGWAQICGEVQRRKLSVVVVSVRGEERGVEHLSHVAAGRMLHIQIPNFSLREIERAAYQGVHSLCGQMRRPMAFLFLDDVAARGGTRALLQTGYGDGRCPVVVIAGKQEMEPYGLPVTYVTHDTEQEARWAVEMIAAQIAGDPAGCQPRQSRFALEESGAESVSGGGGRVSATNVSIEPIPSILSTAH